jgi:hypothetical protein
MTTQNTPAQPATSSRARKAQFEFPGQVVGIDASCGSVTRMDFRDSAPKPPPEGARDDDLKLHWHGETDNVTRSWLVEDLLPETGTGLISGQWGTYKTFVALDLSAAIIAGARFITFPVNRRGGVLFIAAEGAPEIAIRLQAVLDRKYPNVGRVPFSWLESCPPLLHHNSVATLIAKARGAAAKMLAEFGVPLALIVIDTVVASAGYSKSGDENDAAIGQLVMRRLTELSHATGAFVFGVDHFGKAVDTGTRGSSAKEGAADVVLALLGEKQITGKVANTRLAICKRRAGPSGQEFPFIARIFEFSCDHTSLTLEWPDKPESPAAAPKQQSDVWPKTTRPLRKALTNVLATDAARNQKPFPDGPTVCAVDLEIVRREFYASYPAEGDTSKKQAARQKAFKRAVSGAQEKGLIGVRDIGETTWIWLTKQPPSNGVK